MEDSVYSELPRALNPDKLTNSAACWRRFGDAVPDRLHSIAGEDLVFFLEIEPLLQGIYREFGLLVVAEIDAVPGLATVLANVE